MIMVEDKLNITLKQDDSDIPDSVVMRYLDTARIFDSIDDADNFKYVVLVELMCLARENNQLKHDIMTLHQDIRQIVKAIT
jgi:hypothetical protein